MPREAFLVNPPRHFRRRRRLSIFRNRISSFDRAIGRKRVRRKFSSLRRPLFGGSLSALRIASPMRRHKKRRVNPVAKRRRARMTRKRRVVRKRRSHSTRLRIKVGKRVRKTGRVRTIAVNRPRRRRRRNPPLMIAGANPQRRHRRHNRVHRRRSYRHNPAMTMKGAFADVRSNVPYFITGALSAIAVSIVPSQLPANFTDAAWKKYVVQGTVAVGGGMVVGKIIGSKHGTVWMIVGGAMIVADLLKTYLLQGVLGISGYELGETYAPEYQISEYPAPTMDAFPDVGVGAFPDVAYSY